MGNCPCNCLSPSSPKTGHKEGRRNYTNIDGRDALTGANGERVTDDVQQSPSNLQHISERDELDETFTPSDHAKSSTLFLDGAIDFIMVEQRSQTFSTSSSNTGMHKRVSSCSTIFVDDSTVSQPNIKATVKCVSWAVYYLIKLRKVDNAVSSQSPDIFDEKLHPLTKERVSSSYHITEPEHRHIYRFIRNLFSSAQLTAECAIVTLIYLERLLTYAEFELCPANWKRIVLGAILLASKVWDDQAVWNVDYCQILRDISVEDMNELERQFLELLQFNINVPSSVYAKYYFDLRSLSDKVNIDLPMEQLNKEKAHKLEATSRICEDKFRNTVSNSRMLRSISADHLAVKHHNSSVILS